MARLSKRWTITILVDNRGGCNETKEWKQFDSQRVCLGGVCNARCGRATTGEATANSISLIEGASPAASASVQAVLPDGKPRTVATTRCAHHLISGFARSVHPGCIKLSVADCSSQRLSCGAPEFHARTNCR